jgi:nucleotide-binding universal stress UspA family protein
MIKYNENSHPMKNIIVPVDFSVDSLKGLEFATMMSKHIPVKIQLVYVQKKSDIPGNLEEEYKFAEKNFNKIIQENKDQLGEGSQISYIIKKGKVYQEITGQAQAFADSIIVASTHGASGFEELFIGSNAYRIVCSTNRPVITIRQHPVPTKISKIVMPIDIAIESRQKVMFTALIAAVFQAEVHVVLVSPSKNKKVISRLNGYVAQVCNYLKTNNIPYINASVVGKSPIQGLLQYTDEVRAELISIINEDGEGITDLIIGGEAQQIISKSSVPVLTIRAKPHTIKESFSTFGG